MPMIANAIAIRPSASILVLGSAGLGKTIGNLANRSYGVWPVPRGWVDEKAVLPRANVEVSETAEGGRHDERAECRED